MQRAAQAPLTKKGKESLITVEALDNQDNRIVSKEL